MTHRNKVLFWLDHFAFCLYICLCVPCWVVLDITFLFHQSAQACQIVIINIAQSHKTASIIFTFDYSEPFLCLKGIGFVCGLLYKKTIWKEIWCGHMFRFTNTGNLDSGIPTWNDTYSDRDGSLTMSHFKCLSLFRRNFSQSPVNVVAWNRYRECISAFQRQPNRLQNI